MGRATRTCWLVARRRRRSRRLRDRSACGRPAPARAARPGARGRGGAGSRSRGRGRGRSPPGGAGRRGRPPPWRAWLPWTSEERLLQAAVDDECLARDVARALRRDEADDVAELARVAPAAERDLAQCLLCRPLWIEILEARRLDASGRDAVDRDAAGTELVGERLQVPVQRGAESVREREVARRLLRRERRDRDDARAGALLQVRKRQVHEP